VRPLDVATPERVRADFDVITPAGDRVAGVHGTPVVDTVMAGLHPTVHPLRRWRLAGERPAA